MKESAKTKAELITEISVLNRKIKKLEKSEAKHKQAEATLKESELKYRSLVECSSDAIFCVDGKGQYKFTNHLFASTFGKTPDYFIGKTFWDIYPKEHADQRYAVTKRLFETGKSESVEVEVPLPDKNLYFYATANPIKDETGKVILNLTHASDITERKQAEAALRLFKTVFDHSSEACAISDASGRLIYINQAHEKLFGRLLEDSRATYSRDYYSPESIEFLKKEVLPLLKRGESWEGELDVFDVEGRRFPIWERADSIVDSNGKILYSFGFMHDISERKRTEDALRASEEKYRNITENMSDIVSEIDAEGIFKYTSPSHRRIFGDSEENLIGISAFARVHPDDRDRVASQFREGVRTKADKEVEYRFRHADGHYVRVRSLGHSFFDAAGEFAGSIVTTSDITERKQVEFAREAALVALRNSEEFLRETQAIAKIGGYKTNPETDFLQWTEGVFRMIEVPLDYQPSLTEGLKYYVPEYIPLIRDLVTKTLINNEPFVKEVEVITASGKRLWVELHGLKTVTDGQNPYVIGTLQDITARKQAEEEKRILEERLQQADKMEAIGTLAGGIAHDFNNLLMGIQGYASLSLMNLDSSHPNYDRLKRIEQQVQSGADLTKQLLGFARGGRYEVKPTDMNEIIEKTSSMFGRTKKEISIQRKCGKDLWIVEVDRGQMEQVFLNLYVNAWQAMPGGGDIYLETDNAILDNKRAFPYMTTPGKYVKITVTDTGTGMDEKTRIRIFEPFFTTKSMERGTGLGLATTYGIIKGHNGMINVYSEPGHGTTFTIYLPASEKTVMKEMTEDAATARGTETILLVEDEEIVMNVNKELLESMGYFVYVAGSGQEAIAVYMEKKEKIDLVILDMILPGISGGKTFDRLREINPNVKVLLSSGYSINGEAKSIMDRGCKGFIQKPFQLKQLSRKVREILA